MDSRRKFLQHIGTIGHVDHGRSMLTQALTSGRLNSHEENQSNKPQIMIIAPATPEEMRQQIAEKMAGIGGYEILTMARAEERHGMGILELLKDQPQLPHGDLTIEMLNTALEVKKSSRGIEYKYPQLDGNSYKLTAPEKPKLDYKGPETRRERRARERRNKNP